MRIRLAAVALALCVLSLALDSPPAQAGMIIAVNTTNDEFNNDGDCSLLEALSAAEDNVPRDACPAGAPAFADLITIPAGEYPAGGFSINSQMTLEGAGPDTILDGGNTSRPITLNGAGEVAIRDMTIRNGRAGQGGNVSNDGMLSLTRVSLLNGEAFGTAGGGLLNGLGATARIADSVIEGNIARGGKGGSGIFNSGTLQILETTIHNNGDSANGTSGGGITNSEAGDLTLIRSLIADNTTDLVNDAVLDFQGGGLMNEGVAHIENSTISGNTAGSGGGIYNRPTGTVGLLNVTLAGNAIGGPSFGGETLRNAEGSLDAINSIVASPSEPATAAPASAGESACLGEITSLGHNLETGSSCGFDQTGDLQSTDPMLGPLQDNAGPTETHALLEGSPAIDSADDAACPDEDQRDEERPQGDGCDMGAYESPFTAPTPSPTPSPSPTPTGQQVAWGDHNCSDLVDSVDALITLRFDAGLSAETNECPEMGEEVDVANASTHIWGDLDCSGAANSIDALKVLRHDAGLTVDQPPSCPDPGETVTVS